MTDDVLITKEAFDTVRSISKNIDFNTRVMPYALEAQQLDLKPYLGNALYYDLVKNQTEAKYQTLLNGGEYQDSQGNAIYFDGIKKALAYYCLSRFRLNQPINDTAFGVVRKTSEFSEPVEDKTLYRSATELKKAADAYMFDVMEFIKVKYQDYPKYNSNACCSTTGVNKLRITGISKV